MLAQAIVLVPVRLGPIVEPQVFLLVLSLLAHFLLICMPLAGCGAQV